MKYHVLVVEDETTLLHGIMSGLQKMPTLHVTGCSTAEEATNVFKVDPPDIMVTDLNLPGYSGAELITHFRRFYKRTPIIVTTAFQASYAERLAEHRGLTILEKPVSMMQLRSTIESKLAEHATPTPIGPFQLVDYLQLAGYGRHSIVLQLELHNGQNGLVEVFKGDIWNVFCAEKTGLEALKVLMSAQIKRLGHSQLEHAPEERQIHQRWEEVLIDLARIQDESEKVLDTSLALPEGSGELWEALNSHDWYDVVTDEDLASFSSFEHLPAVEVTSQIAPFEKGATPEKKAIATEKSVSKTAASSNVRNMSELDALCREMMERADHAQAFLIVDLSSGMLLGSHHETSDWSEEGLAALGAVSVDVLRSESIRIMHRVLEEQEEYQERCSPAEVFFHLDDAHVFIKALPTKNTAVVLVNDLAGNLGMGWLDVRMLCGEVESAL